MNDTTLDQTVPMLPVPPNLHTSKQALRDECQLLINVLVMQTMTRNNVSKAIAEDAVVAAMHFNLSKLNQNKSGIRYTTDYSR